MTGWGFFHSRLYRKYLVSFALLVGTILFAGGANDLYFSYYEAKDAALSLQKEKAVATVVRIDQFIRDIEHQVEWTMLLPRSGVTLAQRQTEFIKLLRQTPPITNAIWLDAQGRERVRVSRLALDQLDGGMDYSGTAAYQQVRRKSKYFSAVEFREGTEPYMDMAFASGDGVTLVDVNLKFIWDVVWRSRFGETGMAYVVDTAGQLIAHPDISLVLRNINLSQLPQVRQAISSGALSKPTSAAKAHDQAGSPVLSIFARIESMGWIVLVEQQQAEALAPLYASMLRTALLTLLGLALALIVSALLARRMVKPIQMLQAGAARLDTGALDQRIDIHTGDEFESLAEEFNRMAVRLRESYAGLEQKVAERTEQLVAANLAKSRFLAAASHDLRQPMHALGLFVAQLNNLENNPETRHLAGRIEAAVTALQGLLDALLDVSRLDAGVVTPNLSNIPVNHLLERIEMTFGPDATERELRFRVMRSRLVAYSDPVLLERILINLVANALRYTERGGIVVGCRPRGEQIRIEVWDTGVGIAEQHQEAIFQEFYQVDNPERARHKGLGLGLSIAGRLARLLGGRIEVRSILGKGSVFAVQVPRGEMPATAPPAMEVLPFQDSLHGALILVVDDDVLVREAVEGIISQWDCEVVSASTGEEALALIASLPRAPDAILCDYRLPRDEIGIAVVQQLRKQTGTDIPAALVTGDTAPERLREAKDNGFMLLHKPLQPARLRMLLEHLLTSPAAKNQHGP